MGRLLRLRPAAQFFVFVACLVVIGAVAYGWNRRSVSIDQQSADQGQLTATSLPASPSLRTQSQPSANTPSRLVVPPSHQSEQPARDSVKPQIGPATDEGAAMNPAARPIESPLPKTLPEEKVEAQNVPSQPEETQNPPQDQMVQSHEGVIESLGLAFEIGSLSSTKSQITLSTPDFTFQTTGGQNGATEIHLKSPSVPTESEPSIVMAYDPTGKPAGYTVTRGNESVTVTRDEKTLQTNIDKAKVLLSGTARTALQEKISQIETSPLPTMQTDPKEYMLVSSMLINYSVIAAAEGDISFLERNRPHLWRSGSQGVKGRLANANFVSAFSCAAKIIRVQHSRADPFRDCVTSYEGYLMNMDSQLRDCLNSAESRATMLRRGGERLACHLEFTARAQSGIWQLIGCSAVPWK